MGKKSEYLLDSGYTLNMFEIQKYCNKIFQKEYFHSKIHCLTSHLPCTPELRTILFLDLFLPSN